MSKRLHIFQAGKRTTNNGLTLEFSAADIAATANAYDPAIHEAPFVLGHPKLDAPAQGWVGSLVSEDIDLFATPRQVDAQFSEDVKAGRYKKVSAAFYPPDHPSNPVPGVYYLRHVGFLGAHPPAVKGLAPVEFADNGEDLVIVEFGDWTDGTVGRALRQLREWFIGKFGLEEADKAIPGWAPDALIEASVTPDKPIPYATAFAEGDSTAAQESTTMTPEEIAAEKKKLAEAKATQEAEFAEREQRNKEREDKLADKEAKQARTDAVEFADELVDAGRIPPAQKNRVVELLHTMRGVATELEFAEGDAQVKAAPVEALKDFLKSMPVQIEYAELSAKSKTEPADKTNPVKLAEQAVEFVEAERAKGRVISVAQAMDHITQQAGT